MAGLVPYIVSNAKPSRARQFADSLGVACVGLSGKPSPRGLRTAMQQSGFVPDQTVMIGDQLFTDVRAARNARVMAVLVLPVNRHEVWNVAIKRSLEAPLMKAYRQIPSLWPLGQA
jgi:HAD superfamily phosphatase (TIGR01668 family)